MTATGLVAPAERRTITGEADELVTRAEALVAGLDGPTLDVDLARRLVERGARLERIGAAMGAIAARRVADSNAWTTDGDRSPAHWVARHTGVNVGAASATLDMTAQLDQLPEVDEAVRAGKLSATQAREVAAAAAADPEAEAKLVEVAQTTSLGELKAECANVRAAAEPDESERRNKIHRSRRFRHWTDADGAFAFAGRATADEGAHLLAAMKPHQDRIFNQARKQERRDSRDAYAMDALVAVARASQADQHANDSSATGPKALVHVRIDHSALVRGRTRQGETCEIAGVGPVPVATAKKMMNDAFVAAIVTDGVDVKAVAHMGRTIPAHLRSALMERDPCCVVPGCTATEPLEIDHVQPFADGGPTALWNLARVCSFHHDQKTYNGYVLAGTPGNWTWTPPHRPPRNSSDRSPPTRAL